MESEGVALVAMLIPIVAIVGGLGIMALKIYQSGKMRELAYRERIAMIERGLAPPPEVDPARFERSIGYHLRTTTDVRAERHRTTGVMLVGLGMGMLLLLAFAGGEPGVGVGVGGAIALIGVTFLVNSFLVSQRQMPPPPHDAGAPPRPAHGDQTSGPPAM